MQHAETVRQCDDGHQEEEGAGEVTVHAPTAERVHNTCHPHCGERDSPDNCSPTVAEILEDNFCFSRRFFYLFHDELGFTDPVINMAIIRRGMKSFRDNSISARVLICVRQPLSAVTSKGTRWRSRAVAPLYGIAAAHPFTVLAFAEVGQIFRTGDPHGARSVARHYRKLSSFCGSRGRYRKQRQQDECELD